VRRHARWALGLALTVFAAPPAPAEAPRRTLALVGGMLLDGHGGPPLHHAAVVIEGERIAAVGPASEVSVPEGATVVDTRGRVMLPGLIDLHVHLIILGHGDYARWDPWIAKNGLVEQVMEISAKQLLMAGVTSAVDLGGTLAESLRVRDRIARGEIPGPRMWMAGPWITRDLGDYSDALPTQILVDTPGEAARAVDRLADAGVDVIKAYVGLRREHYEAIAAAAHRRKLAVHAHVYDPEDVRNALEAGIDVLAHAGSAGTPPYPPELVRAIAVRGTPVVVTAAHRVFVYPATLAFPERIEDPRLARDFPPFLHEEVMDSLRNFQRLSYFATTDREMAYGPASLRQWLDAGVVLGMGTDSGTPLNFHTEALWREIKAHVDLGMPPQRAISAATRGNARILGRGGELGTIEPGKLADVIVVDGDPLFDITALAHVEVVVQGGAVVKGGPPAR
jgi:imidazolonepropionase-like amidohydrolase